MSLLGGKADIHFCSALYSLKRAAPMLEQPGFADLGLFRVVLHFICLPVQPSGRATTRSDDLIYVKDAFRGKLINVDGRCVTPLFPHLRIAPRYSFASLSMIDHTVRMLARPPSRALFFGC